MNEDSPTNARSGSLRAHALALLAVGAALLAFAGCGDDDDGDEVATTAAASSTVDQAAIDDGVEEYAEYVRENAAKLVEDTDAFVAAVNAGDIERAKALYPEARVSFERIEPVAGAFGDLDPDIDGREGDVPKNDWWGFHPLEKALWINETTKGTEPITKELVSDVSNLHKVAQDTGFGPAEISQGAVDLLGEVSASKITGEEERYSHTDLWDFEANFAGSKAAFEALEPAVEGVDPELVDEIEERFEDVYALLDRYRKGQGFVLYDELSEGDTRRLSQAIDALGEPLSRVPSLVG